MTSVRRVRYAVQCGTGGAIMPSGYVYVRVLI